MEDENDYEWRHIADPRERRKAQNRVNQRNYREKMKRRQEELEHRLASSASRSFSSGSSEIQDFSASVRQCTESLRNDPANFGWNMELSYPFAANMQRSIAGASSQNHVPLSSWLEATKPRSSTQEGEQYVALHMMLRLAKAAQVNLRVLGMKPAQFVTKRAVSPFLTQLAQYGTNYYSGVDFNDWVARMRHSTPALLPIHGQNEIEHHPFIDILPFPYLRQSLLQAIGNRTISMDDQLEFCYDIEQGGLRLWGNTSYEARSYEATEEFVQKWGQMISFGPDVVEATNFWRHQRGERSIALPQLTGYFRADQPRKRVRLRDLQIGQFLLS